MIKRIAMALQYDGARYHGWQHQEEVASIQELIEQAIACVANQSITVVCAGRTDAGVHATAQIIHFDTDVERSERAWIFGVNSNLPGDITVLWAKVVSVDFHARFSALSRTYRYVLLNQPVRPGILRHAVGWCYQLLDVTPMQEAANYLLGEHDFSAYRGSGCQAKHAMRTVQHIEIKRRGRMLVFEVQANAFLLHMVRNIIGVLVTIGRGEQSPEWTKTVLDSRDRRLADVTFSPRGLYLVAVEYPSEFNLPKIPKGPFFLD